MWNRLGQSSLFEERVLIAEEYLMERATRSISQTGIVAAADYIFRRHGSMRIAELVDGLSLGMRQFERRFVQEIGVSPKAFARVARGFRRPWTRKLPIRTALGWISHIVSDTTARCT